MLRAYKYRLYPNEEHKILINKHFDATRLVFNIGLETQQSAYSTWKKTIGWKELKKQLVDLKNGFPFLKEVNSQSLQKSILNLEDAYKKFFKKQCGFPNFKSKKEEQSFTCPQNSEVDFENNLLWLPKFKTGIPIVLHREFNGIPKSVTISKTKTGKYFVSILVETIEELPKKSTPKKESAIGVDVGLKDFAIIGDVNLNKERTFKIENPKYLTKELNLLKRRQRQFDKKKDGSKNKEKARLKLARKHEKIANQRKDFLHKLSYKLTHDNQVDTICIEDLAVKNMIKNHKLAQAISDVAWGEFFRQLKYKSDWYGKNLLEAKRFDATSKDCHVCGYKNNSLTLDVREWDCSVCKTHHDRDENAVPNIIFSAFENYKNKNRDGLPESTLGESIALPVPITTGNERQRTKKSFEIIISKANF